MNKKLNDELKNVLECFVLEQPNITTHTKDVIKKWSNDYEGSQPYWKDNIGINYFDENEALAELLSNQQVFINSHWWEKEWPDDAKKTISINVNCNDVFGWACADAEPVLYNQLKDLYDHYNKDSVWGTAVWCIKNRGIMPQKPVYDAIMKQGIWNLDEMELEIIEYLHDDHGLERYDDNDPKWVSISKIIVPTERDKEQLLKAFEYIHDLREIDTDYYAVNTICHLYQVPDLIEVKNG